MGANISQYYNVGSNTITIPQVGNTNMTGLTLNFVVGKYGSQNVKYIDRIDISYQTTGQSLRTLNINFIDGDNIRSESSSVSFFPQIPIDMFYPIHMWS
jgi:hypothetical protein